MVNNEFKIRDVTWKERKAMMKALQEAGIGYREIVEKLLIPVEFIELAFRYGIEGFQGPDYEEKLNALPESQLILGASKVFEKIFFKLEEEKKS